MSDLTSDCIPGLFGHRMPHAFQPRIEKSAATPGVFGKFKCDDSRVFLEALEQTRSRKYLGDICTRCGAWKPAPTVTP